MKIEIPSLSRLRLNGILGWTIYKREDVSARLHIRVDYRQWWVGLRQEIWLRVEHHCEGYACAKSLSDCLHTKSKTVVAQRTLQFGFLWLTVEIDIHR